MRGNLPTLRILPIDRLIIHEHHDDQRTLPLILRIRASGVFRNPLIVLPFEDGTDRFLVLDGANRVAALREMGFPHALGQVVMKDDPGLTLQNWNHVVWELNSTDFLLNIENIPGIQLVSSRLGMVRFSLDEQCGLAVIKTSDGQSYDVCASEDSLENRVLVLNQIVSSYLVHGRLDRINTHEVQAVSKLYPQFAGLVIFPQFKLSQILFLAGNNILLPAGVTRFTIAPRALHLNYPLEILKENQSLEIKNQELETWILQKIAQKTIRFYSEPTFLFDE